MKSKEELREYQRVWRDKNRDRLRKYNKDRYDKKKDILLPRARIKSLDYYYRNRDKVREKQNKKNSTPEAKAAARAYQLMKKFGITVDRYNEMLAEQNGVCAICAGNPRGQWNRFHVDHDHNDGKIRGLLCQDCNTALGLLKDNPNLMEKAASYVRLNKDR